MCIIVIKEKGVDLPKKSVLKTCFENNPDGCGYMYADGEEVHIRKGFMTFNTFENDYDKINEKFNLKDKTVVYHFRISTQAGVNRQCTHPYPLSKNMKNLKKLYLRCNIGVAHNGVISLTSSYSVKDHNDTMEFITDYLSLIIKNDNFSQDKDTIKLIERLCESKLAILDKNGNCTRINGSKTDWVYDKKSGLYFSNNTYKELTYRYGKYDVSAKNSYYGGWTYRDLYGYDYDDDTYGYNESYKDKTSQDEALEDKSAKTIYTVEYKGVKYEIDNDYMDLEYQDKSNDYSYYSAIGLNVKTKEEVTLQVEKNNTTGELYVYDMYVD